MSELDQNLQSLVPFALLLAVVLRLLINHALWIVALLAAIVTGYFTGALHGLAGLWILILGGLALLYRYCKTNPSLRYGGAARLLTALAFFLFALAMALLLLPGFDKTVLVEPVVLSPGAAPYGIGVGFPKVVAGIFVLGIVNKAFVGSWRELGTVIVRIVPVFAITLLAVMACALLLGYTRFDPKWTTLFLIWAPVNLFFTCFAEEAFFRGFVQHELAQAIDHKRTALIVSIGASALLFGLSHFGGGWKYVLAATVAGFGYALAYQRTQRIEASMAVHFGVNAVHFLLFTYPSLA